MFSDADIYSWMQTGFGKPTINSNTGTHQGGIPLYPMSDFEISEWQKQGYGKMPKKTKRKK